MSFVENNGIKICYEEFGESDDVLLLIAGRGGQLTDWHTEFVSQLLEHNFRVIRFDNRDAGLSTHLPNANTPSLVDVSKGLAQSPYSLSDMASDAVALLDALGVRRAFLMGQSLGAMIAQQIAIDAPSMVRGLVLISGHTGAAGVGMPAEDVMQALMSGVAGKSDDSTPLELGVRSSSRWTSWGLGVTEEELTQRIKARVERNSDRTGVTRQMAAIMTSPDRTPALQRVDVPAVVIHGNDDPLVDVSGGRATAEAIPDAELVIIDKLRHDLPRAVWPQLVRAINDVRQKALCD